MLTVFCGATNIYRIHTIRYKSLKNIFHIIFVIDHCSSQIKYHTLNIREMLNLLNELKFVINYCSTMVRIHTDLVFCFELSFGYLRCRLSHSIFETGKNVDIANGVITAVILEIHCTSAAENDHTISSVSSRNKIASMRNKT